MLQQIKPKNARAARALKRREPQAQENPKTSLFLQFTRSSQILQLVTADLYALKRSLAVRFHKKNSIFPFEDASSLEFFSQKNDASLVVYSSHSKKRPHALTFVRCFDHNVLDMMEFLVDPDTMRTLSQFKNKRKAAAGLKPLISFVGSPFDSPGPSKYTLAKSILLDFFKGPDLSNVDVEGLQHMICISAQDESQGQPLPPIRIRSYFIRTRKSGQRLPFVELEEMGPRIDLRIGRFQDANPDVMKEAMKRPKGTAPKSKKNVETDLIGDKIGRIHIGKQDLGNLQTRKMKGLKRQRDVDDNNDGDDNNKTAQQQGSPNLDTDSNTRSNGHVKRARV